MENFLNHYCKSVQALNIFNLATFKKTEKVEKNFLFRNLWINVERKVDFKGNAAQRPRYALCVSSTCKFFAIFAQKLLEIHKYSYVVFEQSDKKFAGVSAAQSLRGVAFV